MAAPRLRDGGAPVAGWWRPGCGLFIFAQEKIMINLTGINKYWDKPLGKESSERVYGLRDVNLEIKRGEFITIMGQSGSGKSTLLQILGLLDLPSEGEFLLEGTDVMGLPDRELARIRNKFFGFVFQSFHLLPELTALENVQLPMTYAGISAKQRIERAGELLDKVGLSHRIHHHPKAMSGGEQQRVAIARALANDPGFLFADEPTGNLPSETGRQIMEIIQGLNKEGMTIIMVTHDDALGKLGSRCLRLSDGRIVG
jgi:putative ABC transport system ATP-binding protein